MPQLCYRFIFHKVAMTSWGAVTILLLWVLSVQPGQATGVKPRLDSPQPRTALPNVQQLAAGGLHTCALLGDGSAKCWGSGYWGQLGEGANTDRLTPVAVVGLASDISAIAAGWIHTCALTGQGGVICWGRNLDGQLGDNSATDRTTPVNVTNLSSGVTSIVAGGFHTCALTTGGGVRCWGYNGEGQLGDTTTQSRKTPVNVAGLTSGVAAIAAGHRHTCALLTNGSIKCWGENSERQLGNGTTNNSSQPVNVTVIGSTSVTAIGAGGSHTCVLTTAGAVTCWGNNGNGQLGGTLQKGLISQQRATKLCAAPQRMSQGALRCYTGGGQSTSPQRKAAVAASTTVEPDDTDASHLAQAATGMTAMTLGGFHTCALTTNGGVQCWGGNFTGQLGNGTNIDQATPSDVSGLGSDVRAIAAGRFHTCALTTSGNVKCWGLNAAGQVGDSTALDDRFPVNAVGLASGVALLTTGESHTCALLGATSGSRNIKCMGWNGHGQLADNTVLNRQTAVAVVNLTSELTSIVAGGTHTCGVTTNRTIKCWGDNSKGQLGDQTTNDRLIPVDVVTLNDVTAVAPGDFHTCALVTNGRVKCWGDNSGGQLGDGTQTDRLAPVDVSGLNNVSALTAGKYHTCALTTSGGARCWGWNRNGQLGDGTTTERLTPITVDGLTSGVSLLVAGNYHTCALMSNGGVKCWGWNSSGQVGDNTTTDQTTPRNVTQLGNGVSSIALGNEHTCALMTNGSVNCWGNNGDGQLGTGTNTDARTPVAVVGLSETGAALALGDYFTCVRTASGAVKCWGWNGDGQLGDGNAWRLTPVEVVLQGEPPTETPTSVPTLTPTLTPASTPTPTDTSIAPATATSLPTATPTAIPEPVNTPTPTAPASGSVANLYMPLVLRSIPPPTNTPAPPTSTPLPQPLWQRVGQAGLNVSAIAIHNGQLFVGERKENGRPGGLYQRPLNSCQLTPDLTRMDVINNSSVLGLAFQGTQGVAATFDTNLFYSNDNGSSWNQSTTSVTNPRTVAIAGGSVFYAGTEASGIYESTNGGVSWQQLEPDPPAINRVLLDTGTLWIGAQTGVFKRTLGGMTEITAGLHSESSKQVWDFAFRAANEIYIATFDGVYRGDGANAWQSFGLQGKELYTVEFKDDMLYAGVQRGGVWRRAISGSDWVAVTSPGWNSATTVRDLLYDTTTCNGLLAATGDGVWFYR